MGVGAIYGVYVFNINLGENRNDSMDVLVGVNSLGLSYLSRSSMDNDMYFSVNTVLCSP